MAYTQWASTRRPWNHSDKHCASTCAYVKEQSINICHNMN